MFSPPGRTWRGQPPRYRSAVCAGAVSFRRPSACGRQTAHSRLAKPTARKAPAGTAEPDELSPAEPVELARISKARHRPSARRSPTHGRIHRDGTDRLPLQTPRRSSTPPAKSTAASTASGITARSASCSRTTSATGGGGTWSSARRSARTAIRSTWSASTTAIIQNPKTWVASAATSAGFSDPMVDCRETKQRYRADHVMVCLGQVKRKSGEVQSWLASPSCPATTRRSSSSKPTSSHARPAAAKSDTTTTVVAPFTTLSAGAVWQQSSAPDADDAGHADRAAAVQPDVRDLRRRASQSDESKAYLRPETAQGIFLNFKNVVDTTRVKVPFGVAQIGKSFRNEVTPRNFIFRSREFEQMEMEWFCHPDEASKWYEFWKAERMNWWRSLGVSRDEPALPRSRAGRAVALLEDDRRTSNTAIRSPRPTSASSKASPIAATSI